MIKQKFLHRRKRKKNSSKIWYGSKFKRKNNIDIFSELPQHESIRQHKYSYSYFDSTPLDEFLKSKVGCNWNDVYSELLTKVKKNYRYDLNYYLTKISKDVIYDCEYLPRNKRGVILFDRLFVDMNNILCYKSLDELILESKKILRNQKLKEIINNAEIDEENQLSD